MEFLVVSGIDKIENVYVKTENVCSGLGYTIANACQSLLELLDYEAGTDTNGNPDWFQALASTDWNVFDTNGKQLMENGGML